MAERKNTDFERQKKMLRDSLHLMLVASGASHGFAHDELLRIAKRHGKADLDIAPELYALWQDCLLKAVAEFDHEFSEEVESAWRGALQPGIDFMKAQYSE